MPFGTTYSTTNPGSGTLNREDLSDMVTLLEPEETPLYSLANKETATAMNPEWGVDELDDPSNGAGGVLEGADVISTTDQHAGKAKLSGRVQKFRATWMVTTEQEAVASAGGARATTKASAQAKALLNLKRYVEYRINGDGDAQAGDNDTPALTRGLGDWIDSAGPSDVPARYRTPSASIDANGGSINESQFNTVLKSMYAQTGYNGALTVLAATDVREQISNFSRINGGGTNEVRYQVNEDASKKQITFNVEIFQSDFGVCRIINANPKCTVDADRAYIMPMNLIGIKSLVSMGSFDLPNQGGGERGYCECIEGLKVGNPLGLGEIN